METVEGATPSRPWRASGVLLMHCAFSVESMGRVIMLRGVERFIHPPSLHLPVPAHEILVAAQFLQCNRPPGVELVGADPDFGAEAEFGPVGESCRAVPENAGAVDLELESRRGIGIFRDDAVGVM